MGLANIFLESFFSVIFKDCIDYFKEHFGKEATLNSRNCKQTLELQFGEVVLWCSEFKFIGLENQISVNAQTIALTISNTLRENSTRNDIELTEEDILDNPCNYVLFADPGSGKTTTLKRITWRFLFGESSNTFAYPALIRLKDIEHGTLLGKIADSLGIKYSTEVEKNDGEEVIRYYVGEQLIENAIPSFLNTIRAVLILDGYDELSSKCKNSVRKDILQLGRKSLNYKVLLTSRYGEDITSLEGFSYVELKELTSDQITIISKLWCKNYSDFLKELNQKAYQEISNRPLFLNFLILHYNKVQYLPNDSQEIIRQIIILLLEEWNTFMGVKRFSSYSNFYSAKKIDFLSGLAYHLSFEGKTKTFSHSDLAKIYKKICYKYGLPVNEADKVALEIESHTGIVIKTAKNQYEFSHLVLQEYLAGDYVVRKPLSRNTLELFIINPAILAVATCLSSDTGRYFTDLFLSTRFPNNDAKFGPHITIYLQRLISENVRFDISLELGTAFLYLFYEYRADEETLKCLKRMTTSKNVLCSIKKALVNYEFAEKQKDCDNIEMIRVMGLFIDEIIQTPIHVALPREIQTSLNVVDCNLENSRQQEYLRKLGGSRKGQQ